MKIDFNHDLIKNIIHDSSITIPGVQKVIVLDDNIRLKDNLIIIDVWFKNENTNICLIAQQLQKKIIHLLYSQLDNHNIRVNIIVHANKENNAD